MDSIILIIIVLLGIIISGNEYVKKYVDPDLLSIITWAVTIALFLIKSFGQRF